MIFAPFHCNLVHLGQARFQPRTKVPTKTWNISRYLVTGKGTSNTAFSVQVSV